MSKLTANTSTYKNRRNEAHHPKIPAGEYNSDKLYNHFESTVK